MTEKPKADRAVTVAELLARHGQVSGTAGRAHRRRAREGGISVAELTGEIPIIRDPAATQADELEQADEAALDETAPTETGPDEAGSEQVAGSTESSDTVSDESAEAVEVPARDDTAPDDTAATDTDAADAVSDDDAEPIVEDAAADEAEQPKAYSEYDAVAYAGPQSPREFASTTGVPAMLPLAGSIMTADAQERAATAVDLAESEAAEPEIAEPEVAEAEFVETEAELPETVEPEVGETTELATADELATAETAEAGPDAADTADAAGEPVETKGPLRQWAGLAAQAVIGVVVGAALFVGFERLWDTLPYVALVLAILAILAMVAVVRILRKTDDIASVLIAVVVGVIVTIGPLAFVLSTG